MILCKGETPAIYSQADAESEASGNKSDLDVLIPVSVRIN